MIRTLLIITAAGIVISLACFAGVIALGGPQAFREAAYVLDMDDNRVDMHTATPAVERKITWAGAEALSIDLAGDVDFTQGPVPGIVVRGPRDLVDRVAVEGDRLYMTGRDGNRNNHVQVGLWGAHQMGLKISVTAPAVKRFSVNGSSDLTLINYDQPELTVNISGSGDVDGHGKTSALTLNIDGSGDADLEALPTATARISVNGSGDANVDATAAADVSISGSGDVTLLRRPVSLNSDIAGSGDLDVPGQ